MGEPGNDRERVVLHSLSAINERKIHTAGK